MRRTKSIGLLSIVVWLATPALSSGQSPSVKRKVAMKTKAQRYVESVAANDLLKGSSFGVLAMTGAGDTLACWNPRQRMAPASTLKLVTTGVAMHKLGPGFKYETKIAYRGAIKEGILDGDVYIIGGGDPTIASKDSIAIPRFFLFSQWKAMLDKAGIKKINGLVIGDGRYFDGPAEQDTWSYQDIGTAYGTGGDGLCFYENAQDFKVSAGATAGSPVHVLVSYPVTPWMKYGYPCKTSKAGTGDNLYYFSSEYVPYGEVRGSFALDHRAKTEEFSNKFGAYTCAYYFCNYLKSKGFEVSRGPADVRSGRIRSNLNSLEYGPYAAKVDDLNVAGRTYSPTLKKIVRETNLESDNFYAETLFRTLGRKFHHSASYDSSYVAVDEVLRQIGANPSAVRIADGSGLSRHNSVSPEYFVRFLSAMMDSPVFGDYIETLGQPGGRHYESRLKNEKEDLKSRVHLKSGSMTGVRCFSGYIEPSEGSRADVIIFSVMAGSLLEKAGSVDPLIDRIIAFLAAEN